MNARELLEVLHTRPRARIRFRGIEPWRCSGIHPKRDAELGERTVLELEALDVRLVPVELFGRSIVVDPKTREIVRVRMGSSRAGYPGAVPGAEATIDMAPEQDLGVVELEVI